MGAQHATIKSFLHKLVKKDRLKKELKELEGEIEVEMAEVFDIFVEWGISSMNMEGKSLYIHRTLVANAKKDEAPLLVEALKGTALDSFVVEGYSSPAFTAYIKEIAANIAAEKGVATTDDILAALPPEVAAHLQVFEKNTIRARKA